MVLTVGSALTKDPVTPLAQSTKSESLTAPDSIKRVFDPFKTELQVTWFKWLDQIIRSDASIEEKERALLAIFSTDAAKEMGGRIRAGTPQVTPKYDPNKKLTDYLKLDKPIVFYDLETTGIGSSIHRILQISAIKIHPDGKTEGPITQYINPQRSISPGATKKHGKTEEDLKNEPTFKEVANTWHEFFKGCHLGGFNIKGFDNHLLRTEFKRTGHEFEFKEKANIDVMRIYHDKVPWVEGVQRQLANGYKFFCGKDLEDAHHADADNFGAIELLKALFETYPDLPREVNELSNNYATQIPDFVDPEKKFVWVNDEIVFNFGNKHRGQTVKEVTEMEKGYLLWMLDEKQDFSEIVQKIIILALGGENPTPETLSTLLDSVDLPEQLKYYRQNGKTNGNGKPHTNGVAKAPLQAASLSPSSP